MRKADFLQELRETLQGEVPAAVIQENLNYYDSYISQEVSSGRREEAVIDEIGSPRLIAKTIIDSSGAAGGSSGTDSYGSAGGYGGDSYGGGNGGYGGDRTGQGAGGSGVHFINLNKWYWKLLAVVLLVLFCIVVFAILSGLLAVVGGIFMLLLRFAGPLLLIWLLYTLLRGGR